MKIDIAELPNLIELLNSLCVDMNRLRFQQEAAQNEADKFVITKEGGARMVDISHDELKAILQARIDDGCKALSSKYQIDFKNFQQAPLEVRAEAIPAGVFWDDAGGDVSFYNSATGERMGQRFEEKWIDRYREFPDFGSTEADA